MTLIGSKKTSMGIDRMRRHLAQAGRARCGSFPECELIAVSRARAGLAEAFANEFGAKRMAIGAS